MNPAIITALIAASIALITSIISLVGQRRTAVLQNTWAREREQQTKAAELSAAMAKYRRPLLHTAADLQSRLYNILNCGFLQFYGRGPEQKRRYAIESTLFVFAEFFGWVEALRREIQFLDLGDDCANREVQGCLDEIGHEFRRDDLPPPFRVFRGEHRAIGEIMQVKRPEGGVECMGYAAFSRQLEDPEFARWFGQLRQDVEVLADSPRSECHRLERIHAALLRLIDKLDPQAVHVVKSRRGQLQPRVQIPALAQHQL